MLVEKIKINFGFKVIFLNLLHLSFFFYDSGPPSNYDQIRDEDVIDNLAFDETIEDTHATNVNNVRTEPDGKENPGSSEVQNHPREADGYEEVNKKQSKKNSRVDSNYDDIRDSNYETIDEDVGKSVGNADNDEDNYDDYLKPVTNANNDLDAFVDVQRLSRGVDPRKQKRVNFLFSIWMFVNKRRISITIELGIIRQEPQTAWAVLQ